MSNPLQISHFVNWLGLTCLFVFVGALPDTHAGGVGAGQAVAQWHYEGAEGAHEFRTFLRAAGADVVIKDRV